MPNPYKARLHVRRFLNLPGFHGGAYVVAYVEDTSEREITRHDLFGYERSRYVNPQPRIILEIADARSGSASSSSSTPSSNSRTRSRRSRCCSACDLGK